ncbi:MAG: phosphoenolpyruvate carboxylase [Patescibacteria group bacterium]
MCRFVEVLTYNVVMRTIPATMATQHPDNAGSPYWAPNDHPFIGTHREITDCMAAFEDMGIKEYMWDWEGKHADAAVIDKLLGDHHDYFSKNILGKDRFLTFRLPNIWEEKGYSLLQAMTVILSGEDFARDLGFAVRPLFEVILPMTERADQLMHMQKLFQKLAEFKSREFTPDKPANNSYLEIIPLTESVESQHGIYELLQEYVRLHTEHFGSKPKYIRPFLARSDPAIVSGFLATVLANKLALSRVYEFADKTNISVFPISGVGSLPFRGGLTPETVDEYVHEYAGMRTVSLQSAFRYDYPLKSVKSAVEDLERLLPKALPPNISAERRVKLIAIGMQATAFYQTTLKNIIKDLATIFSAVPRRRERRQHIGLLAYGRSMNNVPLPRAITFTSGFYSLGVPPEFIGVGRCLKQLSSDDSGIINQAYAELGRDLQRAGRYLNSDNLDTLVKRNSAWKEVQEDIHAAETYFGVKFGPQSKTEKAHKNLTSNILLTNDTETIQQLISETALLRKSLG